MRFVQFLKVAYLLCACTILVLVNNAHAEANTTTTHELYFPLIFTKQSAEFYNVGQDLAGETDEFLAKMLDKMDSANVHSVRMPFRWRLIQPRQGTFDWNHHDDVVAQTLAHDIEIMGVLVDTPSWANGRTASNTPSGHDAGAYPPTNSADFTHYAARIAERYAGKVDKWVIFNEPNIPKFWRPQPDAERYAELLCDAYTAIKQANPNATVIGGALAGNGINMGWEPRDSQNYLQKLYDHGAQNCYDILAIHPYVYPTTPISILQGHIDETRSLMANYDDRSPLWINEIGWADSPDAWQQPTVSQHQMGAWLTQVYTRLQRIERIYWYNFKDVGIEPLDEELHFGLLNYDFTPKPAYEAFLQLTGGE